MENTYAWITETPSSMTTSKDCTEAPTANPRGGRVRAAPPIRDINRCPAIILAVNRNVKAKGRIKFLRISTIDIKLIRPTGVPFGTR